MISNLYEVGQSDCPHSADCCVNKDNDSAADNPRFQRNIGKRFENYTKSNQHRADPYDIAKQHGCDHAKRCDLAEALFHKVDDSQHSKAS